MSWRENLIDDDEQKLAELLRRTRRVAVLGIKTEEQASQPAFYVAKYLQEAGVEVLPVPVYFPEVKTILGLSVYRRVSEVPPPIDIVDVFRRSGDVTEHVADLLAAKPACVWLQLGIRNDAAAQKLAEAGILVVQDRCLMVDHRRFVP